MKNINYILTFGGWIGFVVTLLIIIFFNTCEKQTPNIINSKTEVHHYYDSAVKFVPLKYIIPSEPIFVPVPSNVDTAKILSLYFAKYPYSRLFQDSNLVATLVDTICQNKFNSPGQFSYKWLKPIKTVESTTITVEPKKRMALLAGVHVNFNNMYLQDFGPDVYLKTKRNQIFGIGYDINNKIISTRFAINLNETFRINHKK